MARGGKVRWGLVGCGDISRKRVVAAIQSSIDCELQACIRRDSSRLEEFQSQYQIPKGYRSYTSFLADGDIDAVYIATPVALHCQQTVEAAEHGKHVLCEKPMAMTVSECRKMIEACRSNGVKLGVSYYRRFYPAVLKIRELLENQVLGKPILARATLVEHAESADRRPLVWRFLPEGGGGGLLMDMASHRLDVLAMLFGLPQSVVAFTATRVLDIPVEDTASLLLRYGNGLQALVFASHCVRVPLDDFEVLGTGGKLKIGPMNGPLLKVVTDHCEILELPKAENVHLPLVEDFNRAIRENSESRVSGEVGMMASIILEAAYRSAKSGKVVELRELQAD
jgi:predicted dehydrogenase